MCEVWLISGMGGALSTSIAGSIKNKMETNMEYVVFSNDFVTHVYRSFTRRGIHKSELISTFDYVLTQAEKETVVKYVKEKYGKGVKKPYPCINNISFKAENKW